MTVDIEAAFFEKVRKHMEKSEIAANSNLRDHFAGLAMSGMAHKFISQEELLAKVSYEMADAMLKQRSLIND